MDRDPAAQQRFEAARARLGSFLKEHREEAGLSQAEMATRLGTSQATVSRIEGGQIDGNPAHAYGMKECYPSAPLDPEARRAYFDVRNPQMGAAGARHEAVKRLNRGEKERA